MKYTQTLKDSSVIAVVKALDKEGKHKFFQADASESATRSFAREYITCTDKKEKLRTEFFFLEAQDAKTHRKWFIEEVFSAGGSEVGRAMLESFLEFKDDSEWISEWIGSTLQVLDIDKAGQTVFLGLLTKYGADEKWGAKLLHCRNANLNFNGQEKAIAKILDSARSADLLYYFLNSTPVAERDFVSVFKKMMELDKNGRALFCLLASPAGRRLTPARRLSCIKAIYRADKTGEVTAQLLCLEKGFPRVQEKRAVDKVFELDTKGTLLSMVLARGGHLLADNERKRCLERLFTLPDNDAYLLEVLKGGHLSGEEKVAVTKIIKQKGADCENRLIDEKPPVYPSPLAVSKRPGGIGLKKQDKEYKNTESDTCKKFDSLENVVDTRGFAAPENQCDIPNEPFFF